MGQAHLSWQIITILCLGELIYHSYNLLCPTDRFRGGVKAGPSCLCFSKIFKCFYMNHIVKSHAKLPPHKIVRVRVRVVNWTGQNQKGL